MSNKITTTQNTHISNILDTMETLLLEAIKNKAYGFAVLQESWNDKKNKIVQKELGVSLLDVMSLSHLRLYYRLKEMYEHNLNVD